MPNRIIKESVCTSDTLDSLSWFEEVVFYRLIINCDDYGRFDGRRDILKAKLFPLKPSLPVERLEEAMKALVLAGCIERYRVQGREYVRLVNWVKHQRVRNSREKYPPPVDDDPPQAAADCGYNPIQSQSISESNHNPRGGMLPPTRQEVADYCRERRNGLSPERFCDYYTANGWVVGKTPMKDWRAAVRRWEKTNETRADTAEKTKRGIVDERILQAFLKDDKETV